MPQVDIKYSEGLALDIQALCCDIELVINKMDALAGACKVRAYPAVSFLHPHCYVRVALLRKPHRDERFMSACLEQLETLLKSLMPHAVYYSVELVFLSEYYCTGQVD